MENPSSGAPDTKPPTRSAKWQWQYLRATTNERELGHKTVASMKNEAPTGPTNKGQQQHSETAASMTEHREAAELPSTPNPKKGFGMCLDLFMSMHMH